MIGRNEGQRLARCLASLGAIADRIYVDSGSTDDSVALAQRAGLSVLRLAEPPPFTAARARNAGLHRLLEEHPDLEFVQMVDGDCEVRPGWIEAATAALRAEPDLALVFGRLREREPERSIYNALCDDEWNLPVGEAPGCGGNALFRVEALRQAGFYNAAMIAAEDSELCARLRKLGWRLRRIDAEMALHDAAMTRFSQWWRRTRRSGHAYGELAFLHPDVREPDWTRTVRGIAMWGGAVPAALAVLAGLALGVDRGWGVAAAALFLLLPLNVARLAWRQRARGLSAKVAWASGLLLMVGKVPQLLGLLGFYRNRLLGRASYLIEHKPSRA